MRVLVTGGAGMIGANVVRRFMADGHDVTAWVRPGGSRVRLDEVAGRVRLLEADMTDAASVHEAVASTRPEAILHLASTIWGARSAGAVEREWQVNVMGMLHLLEAVRAEAPTARVVFAGSSAVYGPGEALREDRALAPSSVYGATKASASLLLQTYARVHGVRAVELRIFMPYGPWEHPDRLVPHVILSALRGEDIRMTAGTQLRDLIYMEDLVEAFARAATRDVPAGSVVNIGCGAPIPVIELVRRILRLMGDPVKALPGTVPGRPDELMVTSAEIAAAKRLLDWAPATSLDEGLRRTIDWVRAHQSDLARLKPPTETAGPRVGFVSDRPVLACR